MLVSKEKVSGLIITHNEEKNIREVLECFDFCDEIVIVDSFSTDRTLEIAETFPNVKIIQNKFENFTKQRNLALDNAKNDWVLFLDGDERITPELKAEIIETLNSENKNKLLHYSVADKESYRKKMIHYGELKGKELFEKGKKYSFFKQMAKTAFKFFKSYILKLGILDGKDGFELCKLQTLSVYETYESLKREERK